MSERVGGRERDRETERQNRELKVIYKWKTYQDFVWSCFSLTLDNLINNDNGRKIFLLIWTVAGRFV